MGDKENLLPLFLLYYLVQSKIIDLSSVSKRIIFLATSIMDSLCFSCVLVQSENFEISEFLKKISYRVQVQ